VRHFLHAERKELAKIYQLLVFRELTTSELEWLCNWVSDSPLLGDYNYTTQSVINWLDNKPSRIPVPEEEWMEVQYMARLAKIGEL
jgi:hypothetical protein